MKNKFQIASKVKNSSLASTGAHETRKIKKGLSLFSSCLFIVVIVFLSAVMVSCSGRGGSSTNATEQKSAGSSLSGTYANPSISYTFTGNKFTAEAFGRKSEGTYQTQDGKLIFTSADGKTETYPFKLEGDVLTYDWNGMEIVLTKK